MSTLAKPTFEHSLASASEAYIHMAEAVLEWNCAALTLWAESPLFAFWLPRAAQKPPLMSKVHIYLGRHLRLVEDN